MTEDDAMMQAVRDWADALIAALELGDVPLDLDAVLGVAGLAARAAVRPAAPVTTYLIGYATGFAAARSEAPGEAFATAISKVSSLVAERRDGEA